MACDDDKSTAADPDNPAPDEQLSADEWDDHVLDGHWPSDELNLSIDNSGDPVITDPQNADETIMRYDRSAGSWVVDSLNTGDATITDATVSNFTDSPTGTYGKTIAAPTPTAYFSGPAHGEGGFAFIGATLAPDGRVIFAPFSSSNVGIFDPSDDSYVSGPAHGEGSSPFRGATLAPD